MTMNSISFKVLVGCLAASLLSSCRNDADVSTDNNTLPAVAAANNVAITSETDTESATQWAVSKDMNVTPDQIGESLDLASVLGDGDIPYPVYPNGSHYRIGTENGLKIIVFETEDTFEEVDAYYQVKAGMARLSAMKDYVRYSRTDEDNDPWETGKPGIVIHEFSSESEKLAAGANDNSRTNIIMSFK